MAKLCFSFHAFFIVESTISVVSSTVSGDIVLRAFYEFVYMNMCFIVPEFPPHKTQTIQVWIELHFFNFERISNSIFSAMWTNNAMQNYLDILEQNLSF